MDKSKSGRMKENIERWSWLEEWRMKEEKVEVAGDNWMIKEKIEEWRRKMEDKGGNWKMKLTNSLGKLD